MLAEGGVEIVEGELGEGSIDPGDHAPPDLTPEEIARLQAAAAQRAAEGEPEPERVLSPEEELLDLYIRFGERIVPARMPDGTVFVTKPFIMPVGKAQKAVEMINALEPFPFGLRAPAAASPEDPLILQRPPQNPEVVCYEILPAWDAENYGNLTSATPAAPAAVVLGDAFVVTAAPDLLEEFESFIDLFAQVPQIELSAKIIEVVETESTDIGIKPGALGSIFQFGSRNFISAFSFNLANQEGTTEALLTLGALQDGVTFNAIIEAVQRWDNVSVETEPRTIVRAGGTSRLESIFRYPYFEVTGINTAGQPTTKLGFLDVGTKLYISPRVVGAKTLALDVQIEGSQVVGSQITFTTGDEEQFSVPILATRSARSLVYMKPGQTLLIGGLTRDRVQNTVNKIPILGDIPLIGMFFRSYLDVHEKEHVIFAISPRIVQQGDFDIDF
jgi:hypothetical protein